MIFLMKKFLTLFLALSLTACGFALRTTPDFPFSIMYSTMGGTAIGAELKGLIESSGKVKVINDLSQLTSAQVVLTVVAEQREKVVVGLNTSGQVREFQLRSSFKFKLATPQGVELIPETNIALQRDVSFNESAVLAKEAEEGLLYRDMQKDIVKQVMRRLAAVRL